MLAVVAGLLTEPQVRPQVSRWMCSQAPLIHADGTLIRGGIHERLISEHQRFGVSRCDKAVTSHRTPNRLGRSLALPVLRVSPQIGSIAL